MTTTLTIYDISCTLFITSHTLYMTSHILFMMSHSLCVLHHTVTLSMTSNPICLWHIHFICHHAQCYDHTAIVCLHSHYAWHYTQWIFDMTHNVPMLWKVVNACHQSLSMYDNLCTTYDITSTVYDNTPFYDIHTHCIHVITPRTPVIASTVSELLLIV